MDSHSTDLGPYLAYLRSMQIPIEGAREEVRLNVGGWRFFLRSLAPGDKRDMAAISREGQVISDKVQDHWQRFLSQSGIPERDLADRALWLLGRGALVDEHFPLADKSVRQVVEVPSLAQSTDGTVTLKLWTVSPPNMNSPYRLTITAPPSGAASIEYKHWKDMRPKKR
jgi:hypothetical protein